jgi:putative exporter of polyketide antibiotics
VPVLAHGGAVGAIAEGAFILIPIAVFAVLARISRKRREAEEAAEAGEAEGAAP